MHWWYQENTTYTQHLSGCRPFSCSVGERKCHLTSLETPYRYICPGKILHLSYSASLPWFFYRYILGSFLLQTFLLFRCWCRIFWWYLVRHLLQTGFRHPFCVNGAGLDMCHSHYSWCSRIHLQSLLWNKAPIFNQDSSNFFWRKNLIP